MLRIVWLIVLLPLTAIAGDEQQADHRGWPCDRKIDPTYIMLAEETGGQVQLFQPSEASGSLALMETKLSGNDETIFRASGPLAGERDFQVTVDSTVESVTFSAFIQCMKSISISSPNGEVLPAAPNSKQYDFISGRILTLTPPRTGTWKIHLAGGGYFSVIAEAKTSINLEARFVELNGRPGHEGYFPIQRLPKRDERENLSLTLSGKIRAIKVKLIDREGALIQELQPEQIDKDEDSVEFLAAVTLTSEIFRIVVEGVDSQGLAFERYDSRLSRTQ